MTKLDFIACFVGGAGVAMIVLVFSTVLIAGYRQNKAQEARIREYGERLKSEMARGDRISRSLP